MNQESKKAQRKQWRETADGLMQHCLVGKPPMSTIMAMAEAVVALDDEFAARDFRLEGLDLDELQRKADHLRRGGQLDEDGPFEVVEELPSLMDMLASRDYRITELEAEADRLTEQLDQIQPRYMQLAGDLEREKDRVLRAEIRCSKAINRAEKAEKELAALRSDVGQWLAETRDLIAIAEKSAYPRHPEKEASDG